MSQKVTEYPCPDRCTESQVDRSCSAVAPAAETPAPPPVETTTPAPEVAAPAAETPAETPAATTTPEKKKKSPMDIVKKFLAKFKKEKKAEPVTA